MTRHETSPDVSGTQTVAGRSDDMSGRGEAHVQAWVDPAIKQLFVNAVLWMKDYVDRTYTRQRLIEDCFRTYAHTLANEYNGGASWPYRGVRLKPGNRTDRQSGNSVLVQAWISSEVKQTTLNAVNGMQGILSSAYTMRTFAETAITRHVTHLEYEHNRDAALPRPSR